MGVSVSGDKVVLVTATVDGDKPLVVISDETINLQTGDRAPAYKVMHDAISDRVAQNKVDEVIIKASAVPTMGVKKAHLEAAELRGVVIAAAGTVSPVRSVASAQISRTFGKRKFDEYLKDNDFWSENVSGAKLRAGSRDAALLLVAAKG
jgi:hypothetical protein